MASLWRRAMSALDTNDPDRLAPSWMTTGPLAASAVGILIADIVVKLARDRQTLAIWLSSGQENYQ